MCVDGLNSSEAFVPSTSSQKRAIEEKLLSILRGVNGGLDGEGIKVLDCTRGRRTMRVRKLFLFNARCQSDGSGDRHVECGLCCGIDDAKHITDDQL